MNSSRWNRYISALPRQPYSLLYWTRSELDAYLVASHIKERAIERITDVTGTYNDLRARIFSKHPSLFPEEVYNIETFRWSFSILFSRLVRLPSMDGKVALVPWADMLNHSPEDTMQKMVETASQPLSDGSQPSPLDMDAIYWEASGGEKKKRVYGLGSQASGLYPQSFSSGATSAPPPPSVAAIPPEVASEMEGMKKKMIELEQQNQNLMQQNQNMFKQMHREWKRMRMMMRSGLPLDGPGQASQHQGEEEESGEEEDSDL